MQVRSLGLEDPLEKEMAAYFNILVWRRPWIEEPGRIQSMGSQRVGHDRDINTLTSVKLHPFLRLQWEDSDETALGGQM